MDALAKADCVWVHQDQASGALTDRPSVLAVLAPVLASGQLDGYGPLHAAHADLLDRAGDARAAAAAWARAIEATDNAALRDELKRRVGRR